jgi:WD40 repeat protein
MSAISSGEGTAVSGNRYLRANLVLLALILAILAGLMGGPVPVAEAIPPGCSDCNPCYDCQEECLTCPPPPTYALGDCRNNAPQVAGRETETTPVTSELNLEGGLLTSNWVDDATGQQYEETYRIYDPGCYLFGDLIERFNVALSADSDHRSQYFCPTLRDGLTSGFPNDPSGAVRFDPIFAQKLVDVWCHRTMRASVSSGGAEGNGLSLGSPTISGLGRHLAFNSYADNLVAGDTNGTQDVFLRDVQQQTTERLSVGYAEAQANSYSWEPSISADGGSVSFSSGASNLTPGDLNGVQDIFLRDRVLGQTIIISVSSDELPGNRFSSNSVVSADDRFVAFISQATNLVPGDTNGLEDIFVRDTVNGTTVRASLGASGEQAALGVLGAPSISADGRLVAFSSRSPLVAGDLNGSSDVFVRDLSAGTTIRVSVGNQGAEGNGSSLLAGRNSITPNGRRIAFDSSASNLVLADTNLAGDIFVRDIVDNSTVRASTSSDGQQANNHSWDASISADGRYVAFQSVATGLVPLDLRNRDVFVKDLSTGSIQMASVSDSGTPGEADSEEPWLSPDGRFVAFMSYATTLVTGDSNLHIDIFRRELTWE